MRTLVAWIGSADLRGPFSKDGSDVGPIANALDARSFERAVLLANQDPVEVKRFVKWLKDRSSTKIDVEQVELTSPTHYGEIYRAATHVLAEIYKQGDVRVTLHLSPGTPAMGAVWVLLGKTRFPAEFIESSKQAGVKAVQIPFDIAAELVPALYES